MESFIDGLLKQYNAELEGYRQQAIAELRKEKLADPQHHDQMWLSTISPYFQEFLDIGADYRKDGPAKKDSLRARCKLVHEKLYENFYGDGKGSKPKLLDDQNRKLPEQTPHFKSYVVWLLHQIKELWELINEDKPLPVPVKVAGLPTLVADPPAPQPEKKKKKKRNKKRRNRKKNKNKSASGATPQVKPIGGIMAAALGALADAKQAGGGGGGGAQPSQNGSGNRGSGQAPKPPSQAQFQPPARNDPRRSRK